MPSLILKPAIACRPRSTPSCAANHHDRSTQRWDHPHSIGVVAQEAWLLQASSSPQPYVPTAEAHRPTQTPPRSGYKSLYGPEPLHISFLLRWADMYRRHPWNLWPPWSKVAHCTLQLAVATTSQLQWHEAIPLAVLLSFCHLSHFSSYPLWGVSLRFHLVSPSVCNLTLSRLHRPLLRPSLPSNQAPKWHSPTGLSARVPLLQVPLHLERTCSSLPVALLPCLSKSGTSSMLPLPSCRPSLWERPRWPPMGLRFPMDSLVPSTLGHPAPHLCLFPTSALSASTDMVLLPRCGVCSCC